MDAYANVNLNAPNVHDGGSAQTQKNHGEEKEKPT
jgi:hypothetical protein